ncbi:MAG: hypothetical protein IPG51_19260 [Chloroflexi bacterium]|nr:hypothetical protein [Chloroflexota bacterium]
MKQQVPKSGGTQPLSDEKRRELLAYVYSLILSPEWGQEVEPTPLPPTRRRGQAPEK